ncbi:MAG: hypothetical protein WC838_07490, partial [Candidatus Margulisiibacteriota bacterium]
MFKKTLLGITLLSMLTITALAVPNQLTYSGRLLQNGALVNSTLTMTFKIWSDLTAGTLLWSTNNITVPVNQGIYSVVLDQVSSTVFVTDNAYLEVIIDPLVSAETLAPRTKINSVGYALQAGGISAGGLQALYVDNAGNIGIGTPTPSVMLTIKSKNISGSTSIIRVQHPLNNSNGLQIGNVSWPNGTDTEVWNWEHGYLRFGTKNNERIRIDATGNVGVGTTNPLGLFQVSANYLVVSQNGNVGIGTTNPGAKMEVVGASTQDTVGTGALRAGGLGTGSIVETGVNYNYAVAGANGWIQSSAGAAAQKLLLNPLGGNVGIGTSMPGFKLDTRGEIYGQGLFSSSSQNDIHPEYPNAQMGIIQGAGDNPPQFILRRNTYASAMIGIVNNYDLGFEIGGAERLRIASGGNVGIGTTAAPGAKLDVNGQTAFRDATSYGLTQEMGYLTWAGSSFMVLAKTGKSLQLGANGDSSGQLAISTAGYVGVGISAPVVKLNVLVGNVDSDTEGLRIGGPANYGSLMLGIKGNPDYDAYIGTLGNNMHIYSGKSVTTEDHYIQFYTSKIGTADQPVMRIDHNGYVGIGLTNPGYMLQVNGSAYFGSAYTPGGVWAGSDLRWKKDVTSLKNPLNKVLGL